MTALTIISALVAVVAAALCLAVTLAWRRALAAAARREDATARELTALHERLARLEATPERSGRGGPEPEFVITRLGEAGQVAEDRTPARVSVTGPAFADAVLRESVVHTAALVHGVRRALAPESRNRVWFEMRRELKRTRKAHKVELKEALREYRARHRAEVPADAPGRIADGAA